MRYAGNNSPRITCITCIFYKQQIKRIEQICVKQKIPEIHEIRWKEFSTYRVYHMYLSR